MSKELPKIETEEQASIVLDHVEYIERKALRIIWQDCLGDLALATACGARPVIDCKNCDGTGFTGDKGPGVCGNQEYHLCNCVIAQMRKRKNSMS